jgi:dTDP-4-dehydrorhamnose 3,5-epimerase
MESVLEGVYFFDLKEYKDERGSLMELFRNDQLFKINHPEMGYISQTLPGVTRGPHEHKEQSDLFCFVGPGVFALHLWKWEDATEPVPDHEVFIVGEGKPVAVIVPPGVVHAYKNCSDYPGIVFNFPNQLYAGPGKIYPVDEIRHEGDKNSPFVL